MDTNIIMIIIIMTSFATNILENQAQWRDKNHGINQSYNRKQCVSRQRVDEEARRLSRIGSIKEIGF